LNPVDEDFGDHLLPVMRVQPLEQLFDVIGNGVDAKASPVCHSSRSRSFCSRSPSLVIVVE